MKKRLKRYFIPHEGNNYCPDALQRSAVIGMSILILLTFSLSNIHSIILSTVEDFAAAVLPSVLVDLTNDSRVEEGIGSLTINPVLVEAAQLKAEHMAEQKYFSHVSPDGIDPWHWFYVSGYQFDVAGENLAVHFHDSGDVVDAWLRSPGHRKNILNGGFTEIGIATAKGSYKGYPTTFVVQLFGTPARIPSAVEKPFEPDIEVPTPEDTVQPPSDIESPVNPEIARDTDVSEVLALNNPPEVRTIEKTDTFIAVETVEEDAQDEVSIDDEERNEPTAVGSVAPNEKPPTYSNPVQWILAQPKLVLNAIYALLAVLISIALIASIVIEIRKQHPVQIAYGMSLLVLMVGLAYLHNFILGGGVVVV